jgi:hypothetical protein
MDGLAGLIEIEVSTGATVSVAEPVILPAVAVIVAVPAVTPVANPVCSLMVATEVLDEVQLAVVVRFCVVPLL